MIRSGLLHRGQASGSTSKMRRSSSAHRLLSAARAGDGVVGDAAENTEEAGVAEEVGPQALGDGEDVLARDLQQ